MGDEGHRRLDRRAWRSCSTRGSATRSASRSRPSRAAPREREVEVAQQVLQSMGLRSFLPQVSRLPRLRPDDLDVLPGDGPATSRRYLRERMPAWRETHPGVEELRVAVMGCVVNGPGESKHADIGISLPGHVRGAGRARCSSTASSTGRCAATASSPSSSAILEGYVDAALPGARPPARRARPAGAGSARVERSTRPGVYSAAN